MAWLYVWNPKETKNKLLEIIRKFNEVIGFRINMQRSKVFLHLSVVQSLNSVQLFKNSVDGSMPGFPVLHHLLELAQTHVHRASDAIQSSHPLSSPSPPALNLPCLQSLFQWVSFLHQVAKGLELQLQSVLPMNIQGWFPLGLTGLIFLQSKGLSRVFSSIIIWKHQFFSAQPSLWSNSHICTRLLEKP